MKILITHSYFRGNNGDAAILYVQAKELQRAIPSAEIVIANMEDASVHKTFAGFRTVPSLISTAHVNYGGKAKNLYHLLRSWTGGLLWAWSLRLFGHAFAGFMLEPEKKFLSELRTADIVIPTGGGYLQSKGKSIYDSIHLSLVLQPIYIAELIRKPVVLYSQSIGPFKTSFQKKMAAAVLRNVARINAREDMTVALLRSIHIPSGIIQRTVDAAFFLFRDQTEKIIPPEISSALRAARRPVIGVTAREWLAPKGQAIYERELARALDAIIKKYGATVILIPQVTVSENDDDDRVIQSKILALMERKDRVVKIDHPLDFMNIKALYGKLDYLIGTRFHSVIFALTELIPAIAIEYEHKTSGIMNDLGLSQWVIPIEAMRTERLATLFDSLVQEREAYVTHLHQTLPRYLEMAANENDFIIELAKTVEKQAGKDILNYQFLASRWFQAYAAILFFLQGKLAFSGSISPLLHGGFTTKNERSKFRHLFFEFINRKFGPFHLYENPFSPASQNYIEAIHWIDEVVKKDQYQTGLIKDGSIVIDAGANIGVFSIKVAHTVQNSTVYSFEPTPRTFEALKGNTAPYPNVTCFNLGLGDEVAKKELLVWDDFSGSNSLGHPADPQFGEPDRVESIAITTIDEIAKNLPKVDFIKMDTEGYEANILKGAAETIKKWKPIIAMSAYHDAGSREELPHLLKSICPDYVCELRNDHEEDLICRAVSAPPIVRE